MCNVRVRSTLVLAGLAAATFAASADLTPIPVFVGTLSEGFESFPSGGGQANPLTIMGGAASLNAPGDDIYTSSYDYSLGDKGLALAQSGVKGFGSDSVAGTTTLTFANAVGQFGGYFNVATLAGYNTANTLSLAFFGQGGAQIGSTQVVMMATTNANTFVGFNSAVPVKSITLSGLYFVGDDLRANVFPTPEPSAFAALGLGVVALLRRRRR